MRDIAHSKSKMVDNDYFAHGCNYPQILKYRTLHGTFMFKPKSCFCLLRFTTMHEDKYTQINIDPDYTEYKSVSVCAKFFSDFL